MDEDHSRDASDKGSTTANALITLSKWTCPVESPSSQGTPVFATQFRSRFRSQTMPGINIPR